MRWWPEIAWNPHGRYHKPNVLHVPWERSDKDGRQAALLGTLDYRNSLHSTCPLQRQTASVSYTCINVHTQILLYTLIFNNNNKLCAWRHNMPPPPASLTIISCKYENRQRLQFTTEFAKRQTTTTRTNKHCAILPSLCRHCQSKAQQNMGARGQKNKLCLFCPSSKLTFDLLTLKCPSHVWRANFSLPRPLCSRLTPEVRDRQTSDVHHCLMPPPYEDGGITISILMIIIKFI